MTDAQALSEIEEAKRILDKHYDTYFLQGVWHEREDGICYTYAAGRYAELAERDSEDEAAGMLQRRCKANDNNDGRLNWRPSTY